MSTEGQCFFTSHPNPPLSIATSAWEAIQTLLIDDRSRANRASLSSIAATSSLARGLANVND
jgi:hypothetical protein